MSCFLIASLPRAIVGFSKFLLPNLSGSPYWPIDKLMKLYTCVGVVTKSILNFHDKICTNFNSALIFFQVYCVI